MKWTRLGGFPVAFIISVAVLSPPGVLARDEARRVGSVDQNADSCPVTTGQVPSFTAPAPYPPNAPYGNFWFGHEQLWTMLQGNGTWRGLPRNDNGFRQKVFWWHPGFDGRAEPVPDLRVSGRRLDATGSFIHPVPATNAHHADFGGWTILTGIDVPTVGCWELTGEYRGQALTFVVRVGA